MAGGYSNLQKVFRQGQQPTLPRRIFSIYWKTEYISRILLRSIFLPVPGTSVLNSYLAAADMLQQLK